MENPVLVLETLYIMQYTHPDLMYTANRIFSYTAAPSAIEFKCVKYLIRYLEVFPNHPIICPYIIYRTATHVPYVPIRL